MGNFLDMSHPALRPLWVRILITAVASCWAGVEFATGSFFWGIVFVGMGAIAAWTLLIAYKPPK